MRQLFKELAIAEVVETGTFIGESTGWFARQGVKVWSVELNEKHFDIAAKRLGRFSKEISITTRTVPSTLSSEGDA